MGPIVASHVERYPNLRYIAQENETLRLLLCGEDVYNSPARRPDAEPRRPPVDPRRQDTPVPRSVALARRHARVRVQLRQPDPRQHRRHCSRARRATSWPTTRGPSSSRATSQIPHREAPRDLPPDTDAAELYEEADYGPIRSPGTPSGSGRFIDYVERHGLRHVFEPGEDPDAFDRRVADGRRIPARSALKRQTRSSAQAGSDAATKPRAIRARYGAARVAPLRPPGTARNRGQPPAASPRRPDGAPRGAEPGPAGSASAAPPTSAGSLPRLPAGRLRHAQDVPRPGRGRPRGGSLRQLRVVERRHRPGPGPAVPRPDGSAAAAAVDALWRRHLPSTRATTRRSMPARTTCPTFAMDVDTASYTIAQRYVADGNMPGPGQRPRRGVGQRLRPGLSGSRGRRPSRSRSTARRRRSPTRATSCSGSGIKARESYGADAPERRADVRHRHLGLDGARATASSWSRIRCGSWSTASARATRSRSSRSVTTPASSCHRRARPTRRPS